MGRKWVYNKNYDDLDDKYESYDSVNTFGLAMDIAVAIKQDKSFTTTILNIIPEEDIQNFLRLKKLEKIKGKLGNGK